MGQNYLYQQTSQAGMESLEPGLRGAGVHAHDGKQRVGYAVSRKDHVTSNKGALLKDIHVSKGVPPGQRYRQSSCTFEVISLL